MEKYEKLQQIGQGNFGSVYLLRKVDTGERLVLKQVDTAKISQSEQQKVLGEVSLLSDMEHPNIVCYKESFHAANFVQIIMEYCAGGDLFSLISRQRGKHLSEDLILFIFLQVCLAVKYIHSRHILHRDIKTQNIFITRGFLVKLGDFGIARILDGTSDYAKTCIGTPYYLSPEICENKPYNNKSDLWALGCVLYEMATLKHAFQAGSMKNLILKIIRGSYPPISSRYSYDLRNLVTSLLRRDPRDRPSIDSVLRKGYIQKVGVFLDKGLPKSVLACLLSSPGKKKKTKSPPPDYTRPVSVKRNKLKASKLNWRSLPAEAGEGPELSRAGAAAQTSKEFHHLQSASEYGFDCPPENLERPWTSLQQPRYQARPGPGLTDFQVNKMAASEFKQRNMNDIFNRSMGGNTSLRTDPDDYQHNNDTREEKKSEDSYLEELDKIHRDNLREKRTRASSEKKADVMWIDFSSEDRPEPEPAISPAPAPAPAPAQDFNRTFTKAPPDLQPRKKKSYDEFLAEYFENVASEEEEDWEWGDIPDILRDTHQPSIHSAQPQSQPQEMVLDERLQTIKEEAEDSDTGQTEEVSHVRGSETIEFERLEREIRENDNNDDDDDVVWTVDSEGQRQDFEAGDLYSWLESERYHLERLLGQEKLFLAYQIVCEMEEEDESAWEKIRSLVGRKREGLVDRIIQLVVADSHYIYSN